MNVTLPYGEGAIVATVPERALVLEPQRTPSLLNPAAVLRAAIASPIHGPPLDAIAQPGQTACIVVSDVTRPVPNDVILPPVLDTLEAAGVLRDDITVLIGTGLHRASRPDELQRILGTGVLSRCRVIDHDARDASTHAALDGTPHRLNRAYVQADVRIVTGFVEPHLFAGYSGGGKAVLPAIASAADIMRNHDARMIGHPRATWCVTDGNPIFEQMRDVALMTRPSFAVNVTLDERKRITGVFAGELAAAHDAAIEQAARQYIRPVPQAFDVVVVTNMGYPADLVLYQAVKGMSVAAQACAPGGTVLLVAECREGVGGAEYAELMRSEASPAALLDRFADGARETVHDQWQVQVQAMVQARCDVWLHSSLDRGTTESAHLRYAATVDGALEEILAAGRLALGREPSVCVLPYGQLTVPRVAA
jgi:nickel-dependent lactate racemase